jgi:ribose transport system substrate-binding protein
MCQLAKQQGKTSGDVLIESSVAGVQTIKDRDSGFKAGLASCGLKVANQRFNNNDINTAASQVNDAITANQNLVGIFADNNVSGVGAARAITDNHAADRIAVVGFDSDPQENAALKTGAIDALVVQNPYFFGYQGVAEAAAAAAGTQVPPKLDPGAVVADKTNMNTPAVKQLLNPPTAKAQG